MRPKRTLACDKMIPWQGSEGRGKEEASPQRRKTIRET
nr:MAG TPA: hypothetical protein [Caudoviricetes sp.]